MNTFNMKQWLIENKIGPYGRMEEMDPAAMGAPQAAADAEMEKQDDENSDWIDTSDAIGEGHYEKDPWLEAFENALIDLPIDQPFRIMIDRAYNKHTEDGTIDQYRKMDPRSAADEYAYAVLGININRPKSVDEYSSGQDHIQYDEPKFNMPFASEKPDPVKYKIQRDEDGKVISATNIEGNTFKKGDTARLQPQDHSRVITISSFIEEQGKVKALYLVRGTPYVYNIDGLEPVNPEIDEEMGVGYVMKTKPSDPKY